MKKTLRVFLAIVLTVALALTFVACDQNGQKAAEKPVGIITAMSSELTKLLDEAETKEVKTLGGVEYNIGTLKGKDVVLVQGGVGKTMAAASTAVLINVFDVDSIIFTGVAGAVADEINVLDEVIATDLIFHDYGNMTNEGFVWQATAGVEEDGSIPIDSQLSQIAYDAAVSVLGQDRVFKGRIATGDQFIANADYVEKLQEDFSAIACEMEGAAVARVAAQYETPCCVIRAMSDKADGAAHETYENFVQEAANNSASIVLIMLEKMD